MSKLYLEIGTRLVFKKEIRTKSVAFLKMCPPSLLCTLPNLSLSGIFRKKAELRTFVFNMGCAVYDNIMILVVGVTSEL